MEIIRLNYTSYLITMHRIYVVFNICCVLGCVTITGGIQDHGGGERRTIVRWTEAEDSDSSCTVAQPSSPSTG